METIDAMEVTYDVRFHDIDLADSSGITPLMMAEVEPNFQSSIKRIRLLISKGENLHRRFPRSNTTAVHFLNLKTVQLALDKLRFSRFELAPFQKQYTDWRSCISEFEMKHFFYLQPMITVSAAVRLADARLDQLRCNISHLT